MKKIFLFPIVLLSLFAIVNQGCSNASRENKSEQTEEKIQYQCPMDCEKGKIYDKTGQCPVCGMDLEETPVKS